MSCACRGTPLRIFVQGLSQVHKVETSASPLLRLRQQHSTPSFYRSQAIVSQRARPFHASRQLSQESAEPAPPTHETHEDSDTLPAQHVVHPNYTSAPASRSHDEAISENEPHRRPRRSPPRTEGGFRNNRDFAARGKFSNTRETDARETRPRFKQPPQDDEALAADPIVGSDPSEPPRKIEPWKSQKAALKKKFPEGWKPQKRLSPDALAGIRALNAQFPDVYTTQALADKFEVSPEVIRRILKSKWQATAEEEESRRERWLERGKSVWERKAALGIKPPRKWREEGIVRPTSYHSKRRFAVRKGRDEEEEMGVDSWLRNKPKPGPKY